jgi:quercetin dioxygenase-like cupin family protein
MKHLQKIMAVAMTMAFAFCMKPAMAQDPLEVAPDMYKEHFENDRVRVMEVTFQLGQKIALHSHPDHVAYLLNGGKLKVSTPDGKTEEVEVKTGDVVWFDAVTHSAENVGDTEIRILVVELKEPKAVK